MSKDEFEVVVIDNGSGDDTKGVVDSFQGRIRNLRYFYEKTPGLYVGRHKGLKEASSDILVYADDDIRAFPSWIEGIKESFTNKEVVLVGGKILPQTEGEMPDWIAEMWNRKMECGRTLSYLSILDFGNEIREIHPYYVYGCNFAIRKSVLIEAGGFHPDSMPQELIKYRGDGETHVSRHILLKGYKSIYNPKASVFHLISKDRLTLDYFCLRAYYQGISDSYSKIRLDGGLLFNKVSSDAIVIQSKNNLELFNRMREKQLKEIPAAIWRRLKHISRRFAFIKSKQIDYLVQIQEKIKFAYNDGWCFHRNEVLNDPELLKWVLKENYFN